MDEKVPAFCEETAPRCPPNGLSTTVEAGAGSVPGEGQVGQLGGDPAPRGRVAEAFGADGDRRGARGEEIGRVAAASRCRPCRSRGSRPSPRRVATCSRAIARIAGPETPPVRPPSHGSRVCGWSAIPLSVLTSETASAPALLGGRRDGRGLGRVRRELHDQRLLGLRADPLDRRGRLGRIGAHDEAGLDVRARDVQLDHRHLVARPDGRDERRELVAAEAHHRDDQRHGQLGELRQVRLEEAVEPLVRQPDRVDQPGRRLPQPRRRVALARLER